MPLIKTEIITTPAIDKCHIDLDSLAQNGLPADANIYFRGRNIVARSADGGTSIKAYRMPGFIKGIIYGFFRAPKAKRALINAQKLRELDVATPEPYACVIRRRAGLLRESYFLCEHIDGWSELRGIEERADFPELARALAAFMLTLHRKGIFMKDFSQGNTLFRKTDEKYEFALVDINRMEFGVSNPRTLLLNFQSTLDTLDGLKVLGKEYIALNPIYTLEEIVETYQHRRKVQRNKRRFKKLFGHG